VEVGEHVAGLVEDEARTLALLRHRAIKEVEDQVVEVMLTTEGSTRL
jgi:hypothetical protein